MKDFIVVAVLLLIVGVAIWYIVRSKKNGKKCIGCPDGCCPNRGDGSSCSCQCHKEK